jgi:hypothetical protein
MCVCLFPVLRLLCAGALVDPFTVLAWLWAIEAYQALGKPLPVNVKLVMEGMEESGSEGMDELIDELAKPGQVCQPGVFLQQFSQCPRSCFYWPVCLCA